MPKVKVWEAEPDPCEVCGESWGCRQRSYQAPETWKGRLVINVSEVTEIADQVDMILSVPQLQGIRDPDRMTYLAQKYIRFEETDWDRQADQHTEGAGVRINPSVRLMRVAAKISGSFPADLRTE
jgi:hypothetical protein